MRNVPRHARTSATRSRGPGRSSSRTSAALRRAAQAAYGRPDTGVPFERRPPARQTYWFRAARRALRAALDPSELSQVIAAHSEYSYDAATGLYRCACGWYQTRDWQEHTAVVIRTHILGGDREVTMTPATRVP